MNTSHNHYRIEQFTFSKSQIPELSSLIADAFVDHGRNEGGTIAFDEDTFRLKFDSPIRDSNVYIRAVHEPTSEIVGFLGGVVRHTYIEGEKHKIGAPAWIAVRPDHQRKGIAKQMGIELMKAGLELGYHGGLGTFEPEAHGIDTAMSIARDYNLVSKELVRINNFVIRVYDAYAAARAVRLKSYEKWGLRLIQGIRKVDNPQVREFEETDAARVYELTNDFIERNQIAFVREKDEFMWFLKQKPVNCVVHEDSTGEVDGFLIAWEHLLGGIGEFIPAGWLSHVHTHRLEKSEAINLVRYLDLKSHERGWLGIQSPYIPYFDAEPFKKSRYQFYKKQLLITLFATRDVDMPDQISSIYYDYE